MSLTQSSTTEFEAADSVAPNVISVTGGKGGIGKSSLTLNMAALAADKGVKVLTVDIDPQGNLSRDLLAGAHSDQGEGLLEALMFNRPLKITESVRPGLDLVVGGHHTEMLSYDTRGDDRTRMTRLRRALNPIAADYDLVFIDHPPLVRPLREMGLAASRFAVIPTRPDDCSIDGVGGVARDFTSVRQVNPDIELLGVVLFGVGSSSKSLRDDVRRKVSAGLGETAPVFDPVIRYMEAPATNARNEFLPVHEYARQMMASAKFTDRKRGHSAAKLAGDYLDLTTDLLEEMGRRLTAHADPGRRVKTAAGGSR